MGLALMLSLLMQPWTFEANK